MCDPDRPATASLPAAERALRVLRRELEDQAMAIQTICAGPAVVDLSAVVAAAQVNADAECIGDLARRLADIAHSRRSRLPVPGELQAIVCRMGQIYAELTVVAGDGGMT